MIDTALQKTGREEDGDPMQPETQEPEQSPQTDGQDKPRRRQWTSSIPQIAGEHAISIGNGRYAHFRLDRRFAQVQVVFTAPEGVDPNPGRELTDQFKELGWTWRPNEPGKPWTHQLDKSSEHDPTARADSHAVLHEQFLIIIQEYRQKHGMPPIIDWPGFTETDVNARNAGHDWFPGSSVNDQASSISEKQTAQSAEEETRAGGPAQEMLDAFASVGAQRFDLTFTDMNGDKVAFRSNQALEHLRSAIPAIVQEAAGRQHNVIVRPRSAGATLIQLDDLGEDAAAQLRPASFLVLRTSPGSFQAWVAVDGADEDFARRLRKGTEADLTASGASRVSGSLNFKEKHAPAFPRIETVHVNPGKVASRADVEALGVVAPSEKVTPMEVRSHRPGPRGWPSYQQCLEHPNARKKGHTDRSGADFTWCMIAFDWGWSVEEIADRLMQESDKAQENGPGYALRTAQRAVERVERRGGRGR